MEEINNLIAKSGDSIFHRYEYNNGVLTIFLLLGETDENIKICVNTDLIAVNNYSLGKEDSINRTCRIELIELSKLLSIENGIYVPHVSFSNLMKECRSNLNLAYGKKTSKVRYLLSLVGYGYLLSCTLTNIDDANVSIIYI